jgi:hypothetical protein
LVFLLLNCYLTLFLLVDCCKKILPFYFKSKDINCYIQYNTIIIYIALLSMECSGALETLLKEITLQLFLERG